MEESWQKFIKPPERMKLDAAQRLDLNLEVYFRDDEILKESIRDGSLLKRIGHGLEALFNQIAIPGGQTGAMLGACLQVKADEKYDATVASNLYLRNEDASQILMKLMHG